MEATVNASLKTALEQAAFGRVPTARFGRQIVDLTGKTAYTARGDQQEESFGVFLLDTDTAVLSLPAAASYPGMEVSVVNMAADGAALISISPVAADGIIGTVVAVQATGTANKDLLNTKTTANQGDRVTLLSLGARNKWLIIDGVGVWASEDAGE